jgi:hypothetical protein
VFSAVVIGIALYSYRSGWWRTLYRYELDVLIIMGTLVLPGSQG